jgi:hypothetical protein
MGPRSPRRSRGTVLGRPRGATSDEEADDLLMVCTTPAGLPEARRHLPRRIPHSRSAMGYERRWSTPRSHRLPSSTELSVRESASYLDSPCGLLTLITVMAPRRANRIAGEACHFQAIPLAAGGEG